MPSDGKPKRRKSSRKKSELDSALDQVGDESVAAAMKEFQDLLSEAKGDTAEQIRQNAEELERLRAQGGFADAVQRRMSTMTPAERQQFDRLMQLK